MGSKPSAKKQDRIDQHRQASNIGSPIVGGQYNQSASAEADNGIPFGTGPSLAAIPHMHFSPYPYHQCEQVGYGVSPRSPPFMSMPIVYPAMIIPGAPNMYQGYGPRPVGTSLPTCGPFVNRPVGPSMQQCGSFNPALKHGAY